jgi:hypothetical protein
MEIEATIEGLQRIAIHGSPYVRVFFSLDENREQIIPAQLPEEAVDSGIKVGDRVRLTMLMQTVMEVRRIPTSS